MVRPAVVGPPLTRAGHAVRRWTRPLLWVRCFALREGQDQRYRSEVLGTTTAELVAAVDWPPRD